MASHATSKAHAKSKEHTLCQNPHARSCVSTPRYMLSDERPVKERMLTMVRDFDPAHAKALGKESDARYNLASGLTQTVRKTVLGDF